MSVATQTTPPPRAAPTGADPGLLLDSVHQRIAALDLDLCRVAVVTEAATGIYATTPVIAAMAGA